MSVLLSLLLSLRTWARSLRCGTNLQVLQRTRPRRLRFAKADRWLWGQLSRIWTGWRAALVIVKTHATLCLLRLRPKNSWDLEGTMVVIPFYQASLAERS